MFQGDDKYKILDKKVFDGGIINNIITMVEYIERHIDVEFVIKKLEREEIPQYPEEAYREAIVNAVMHRDYFDLAEDIVLELYKNRLVVRNPGKLLGMKVEDLGRKSRIRNTLIADLLLRTPYVEKLGTGFIRMNRAMKTFNLNSVAVTTDEFLFSIELFSRHFATTPVTTPVTTPEQKVLNLIKKNNNISKSQLAELLDISRDGVTYHVRKLRKKGLLEWQGTPSTGHWEIK